MYKVVYRSIFTIIFFKIIKMEAKEMLHMLTGILCVSILVPVCILEDEILGVESIVKFNNLWEKCQNRAEE